MLFRSASVDMAWRGMGVGNVRPIPSHSLQLDSGPQHAYCFRMYTYIRWLCAESVLSLGDGWLVAWGLCGSMLIRFSTVWLLPFTLL